MKLVTLGDLRARVVPAGRPDPRLVVVLLHGFGAPGDDLVSLAEWIDVPGVAWVFPEAPLELGGLYGDARAWWMLDLERIERDLARRSPSDRSTEVPEGMAPARARIVALLDAVRTELGVPDDRVVLGGFSQGAMLAIDVVLHTTRAFAGAALLSGTLLARQDWEPRMAARAGLRVLQSHGTLDGLLPYAAAETLRDLLVAAGWRLDWIPFDGGHELPPPLLGELGEFLAGLIPPT
ncbi:MAG: phospholipase [Kofleriaceae bacterium]|nr:phospholipase [Kofleriaceae bacterium]MCB9571576.1 phospholipase [Kofleriaceae bacterium]